MQNNFSNLGRRLGAVNAQQSACEREKKLTQLTLNELKQFPASTTVYKSVGKMFVRSELRQTCAGLEKKKEDMEREAAAMMRAKTKLERDVVDAQKSLQELVDSLKQ
jgi:prefoldin subunit 1